MTTHPYFDDISLTPFKKELMGYSISKFWGDITAAISVALLTLPQAMAYSLVAGLPLYCGLFAAIFSPLIAALFGSSRHLVVGPSNAISILIQAGTAEILMTYYGHLSGFERGLAAVQIMTQLTLLVGFIHILAAGFKLGRLTQFVSYSVVVGYIMGVSVAILVSQLYILFGVANMPGTHSIFAKGIYFLSHLHQVHFVTAGLGVASFLMIHYLKKWNRKFPAAVATFIVAALITSLLGYFSSHQFFQIPLVGDAGKLTGLRPTFSLPHFDLGIMNNLISLAFAVAFLSILETTAVAKAIAANTGQRLSTNQEILSLGLGNLTSAFVGAMPISGSTSRSSLNYECGAQTRMAAILSAILVGVVVFALGNWVTLIPQTALAALLVYTAFNLVSKQQLLLCIKSTSSDAWVFWITFLATLFFSLDIAFYMGVMISITLYLKKAATPQLQQYTFDDNYKLKSLDNMKKEEEVPIRVIKVKGELFFGAADLFQTTLKAIAGKHSSTRVIILQLKNARDIDATSCLALKQLHDFLRSTNRYLICSGITLPLWEVLSGSGMVDLIGKENLFLIEDRSPQTYMHRAIDRARELASKPTDEAKEESVEYQIVPDKLKNPQAQEQIEAV